MYVYINLKHDFNSMIQLALPCSGMYSQLYLIVLII